MTDAEGSGKQLGIVVRTRRKISELKPHPHRELIPPMSPEDYANLLEDVKRNGILQPIDITPDNVILDGHQRVKVARELGIEEVEVRIPELVGIDEDEYLISVTMNRRHLTEGQKAVLANEYRKILSKKRQSEAGKKAVTIREIKRGNIDSETVSESIKAEVFRSSLGFPVPGEGGKNAVREENAPAFSPHFYRIFTAFLEVFITLHVS